MELKELTNRILELFGIASVEDLGSSLMDAVMKPDEAKLLGFIEIVGGDLSKDWLQMIYQYYCADRKDKKQDYTPKCLASFISHLIGECNDVIDMCAGSGALTIQRWTEYPDATFTLYELDEAVIPYLLFNMAVRNITSTVYRADVLQNEVLAAWKVTKGDRFGKVIDFKSAL